MNERMLLTKLKENYNCLTEDLQNKLKRISHVFYNYDKGRNIEFDCQSLFLLATEEVLNHYENNSYITALLDEIAEICTCFFDIQDITDEEIIF